MLPPLSVSQPTLFSTHAHILAAAPSTVCLLPWPTVDRPDQQPTPFLDAGGMASSATYPDMGNNLEASITRIEEKSRLSLGQADSYTNPKLLCFVLGLYILYI